MRVESFCVCIEGRGRSSCLKNRNRGHGEGDLSRSLGSGLKKSIGKSACLKTRDLLASGTRNSGLVQSHLVENLSRGARPECCSKPSKFWRFLQRS